MTSFLNDIFVSDDELQKKYDDLLTENKNLRKKISESKVPYDEKIDKFVEKWYEENKDSINIGEVNIAGMNIDLMPNELEKSIYKKSIKILFAFMHSTVE